MAEQSELRMNLAAIKRVDPYAKAIVDSSAHVAFYTFNADDTEWEKTDVEGAFFIYSRTAEPLYSIFINNRLNTNSLVEPICGQLELQSQPPFLLYRNERCRIRGFWFYNKAECDRIGELVESLIKSVAPQNGVTTTTASSAAKAKQPTATNQAPPNQAGARPVLGATPQQPQLVAKSNASTTAETSAPVAGSAVNIFTMLSKAQEDFNNAMSPATKNTSSRTPRGPATAPQPIPNQQQPQSAPPQATPTADGTSLSVMNFFAAAVPATAKEVPFFQRMLSQPMSVDQLEKQHQNHRSVTPQQPRPDKQPSPPSQSATKVVPLLKPKKSTGDLENGFGFMRIASPTADLLGTSPLATFINSANLAALPKASAAKQSTSTVGPTDVSAIEMRQQPLQQLLRMSDTHTPDKPALMAPTMFAVTTTPTAHPNHLFKPTPIEAKAATTASIGAHQTSSFNHHHPDVSKPARNQPEPLTQSQLLQAMNYLIKNDPDFVRRLHEAYLKSFTEMVSL